MIAIRPIGLRQNRFATEQERRLRVYERVEADGAPSTSRQIVGICLGAILLVIIYLAQSQLGL
ncbi:MAG: hypothetical protein ACO26U_03695 [Burkholderiaceae bacterium]